MFNLSGSEIVVILLLALIVLGPEKLPEAMRRAGKTFAEIKKLSSGFQDEVRKGFDEPAREVKRTAAAVKSAARFPVIGTSATTADKPTYNPVTDPPPQPPEGSTVAEPLAQDPPPVEPDPAPADPPPAEVATVAADAEVPATVAAEAEVPAAGPAEAEIPAATESVSADDQAEPVATAEADRSA